MTAPVNKEKVTPWRGTSRPSPSSRQKLDWIDEFVATEIEPLDLAFSSHLVYDKSHPVHERSSARSRRR